MIMIVLIESTRLLGTLSLSDNMNTEKYLRGCFLCRLLALPQNFIGIIGDTKSYR